jgi:hypothetical protein
MNLDAMFDDDVIKQIHIEYTTAVNGAFDLLPMQRDVWGRIFGYLPVYSKMKCSYVCVAFREHLRDDLCAFRTRYRELQAVGQMKIEMLAQVRAFAESDRWEEQPSSEYSRISLRGTVAEIEFPTIGLYGQYWCCRQAPDGFYISKDLLTVKLLATLRSKCEFAPYRTCWNVRDVDYCGERTLDKELLLWKWTKVKTLCTTNLLILSIPSTCSVIRREPLMPTRKAERAPERGLPSLNHRKLL